MSITIAVLKSAGLTAEQIVSVLQEAELERAEKRRIQNRGAQARKREREAQSMVRQQISTVSADVADAPSPQVSPPSMVSPITPSLTTPPSSPPSHSRAVAGATRPAIDEDFQKFWEVYPKRDGANPKAPARKQFLAALKAGTEAGAILAGAGEYARRESERIGTPYIAQAVTWLRQRRWEDYAAAPEPTTPAGWKPGMRTAEEILAELREKQDGEAGKGMGLRLQQRSPMGEDGLRAREGDQGMGRDQARVSGIRPLASILPKIGMGANRFPGADEGGGESECDLDGPGAIPRMAHGG